MKSLDIELNLAKQMNRAEAGEEGVPVTTLNQNPSYHNLLKSSLYNFAEGLFFKFC